MVKNKKAGIQPKKEFFFLIAMAGLLLTFYSGNGHNDPSFWQGLGWGLFVSNFVFYVYLKYIS
ncbi:MAG: hypothetical protein U0524_04075 [Candidatus Saccharimonadales bacterium]